MAGEKGYLFLELDAAAGVVAVDCELHVVEDNPTFDADWYASPLSEVLFGGWNRLNGVSVFFAKIAIFGYEIRYHTCYESKINVNLKKWQLALGE